MRIDYHDYVENNIEFRIVSSKMIERYKSTQSFVLSEMIHGEYKFSKTSKEIVLLVTDTVFAWVIGLENYLIRDGVPVFDTEAKDFAIKKAIEVEKYYMDIIRTKSEIFDSEIAEVWESVHIEKFSNILEILSELEGTSDIEAFSTIVAILIEMLDTLKFELYEIDYLVNDGEDPFLCMTDLCIISTQQYGKFLLPIRAKIYNERFNIKEEGFIFKNYSQEINPITYLQALEDDGIKISNKYLVGKIG